MAAKSDAQVKTEFGSINEWARNFGVRLQREDDVSENDGSETSATHLADVAVQCVLRSKKPRSSKAKD